MRPSHSALAVLLLLATTAVAVAQPPAAQGGQQRPAQPATPGQPPPGGPGGPGGPGRGGGRGGVQVMTLTTNAWPDGGTIPAKHTQMGPEISPAFTWSNVPDGIQSFVLIAHDLDAAIGNGLDDVLHWMVWNIPGTARSLPEGIAQGATLPDGSRQMSATGPYYRGPGALASGPVHHYVFELYALDSPIDVPAATQNPPQTRAAVMAALAGKVRGKGVYTGLFKRP